MELIRIHLFKIFIFLIFFLGACNAQEESESSNDFIKDSKDTCYRKENLVKEIGDSVFIFETNSIGLKRNLNSSYDLTIKNLKYLSNLSLESANINSWYYSCQDGAIILIEGDDYYGSVFYLYLLEKKELYLLGDIIIEQPNVEVEGIFKKDFKISKNDEFIEVISYLDNKVYNTVKLKKKKILQLEN